MPGAFLEGDEIQIGEGSIIEPGAFIKAPTIIGKNTQVRQGAYIRGNVIVGDNCVVGHTTEIKNSIMLNGAKAGHFAYIGDSILGNNVNLGAGTKLANFEFQNISSKTSKKDEKYIALKIENKPYPTELKKLGAILGDNVETGCNCVTAPGVIMGKECVIYPNVYVPKGYYPPKKLIRLKYRELEIKDIDNS
jgi:NDP-sugar pyrophosphorylase family protein